MQPTQENISTVTSGLEQFFAYMIQTRSFDLKTFVNFMEPRFKAAGYRDAMTGVVWEHINHNGDGRRRFCLEFGRNP